MAIIGTLVEATSFLGISQSPPSVLVPWSSVLKEEIHSRAAHFFPTTWAPRCQDGMGKGKILQAPT